MRKTKKALLTLLSVACVCVAGIGLASCENAQVNLGDINGKIVVNVEQTQDGKLIIRYSDGTYTVYDNSLSGEVDVATAETLQYQKIVGKEEYRVIGLGTVSDLDVVIPATHKGFPVTEISESAFSASQNASCKNLTSITIPDSVTSIGERAFLGCIGLTKITIPDSVTSIGNYAFDMAMLGDGSWGLTDVYITDIEAWCNISFAEETSNPLWWAENLYLNNKLVTKLELPNTIMEIKDQFGNCSSLTEIVIPESVTSIGENVFDGCSNLYSIVVSENNTYYASQDGMLYNKEKTEIIIAPRGLTGKITLPNKLTSINSGAFAGCRGLTEIVIPDSVTSIGAEAFRGCSSLTKITIPDGVTSIEDRVFSSCRGLTEIVIPDGVTSIGKYAFYNCDSLTEIVIPDSVTSIGSMAFHECSNLTIYCEAESQPSGWSSQWNIYDYPVVWGYKG